MPHQANPAVRYHSTAVKTVADPARRWSRRALLRALGVVCLAPLPVAFASFLDRLTTARRNPQPLVVPAGAGDPVTFAGDAIVCRDGDRVKVFSARCPHLGCRIDRVEGDVLVCPCHGSRFHLDGSVAVGPAARPLTPLAHDIDPRSGALVIHDA